MDEYVEINAEMLAKLKNASIAAIHQARIAAKGAAATNSERPSLSVPIVAVQPPSRPTFRLLTADLPTQQQVPVRSAAPLNQRTASEVNAHQPWIPSMKGDACGEEQKNAHHQPDSDDGTQEPQQDHKQADEDEIDNESSDMSIVAPRLLVWQDMTTNRKAAPEKDTAALWLLLNQAFLHLLRSALRLKLHGSP